MFLSEASRRVDVRLDIFAIEVVDRNENSVGEATADSREGKDEFERVLYSCSCYIPTGISLYE